MESPSKPYSRPRVRRDRAELLSCQDCKSPLNDDNWAPSMQGKTGFSPRYICKSCWVARQKRYALSGGRDEFLEKKRASRRRVKERQNAWSPERRAVERRRHYNNSLMKNYGITIETYEAMHEEQQGKCLICSTEKPRGRGGFHVDHCHETGVIRGLLCAGCNMMLGLARDSPGILNRAIEYIADHRPENRAKENGKKF